MRVVFIFVVLLLLIALAAPVTFAVQVWQDGAATIARAEHGGTLPAGPNGPLTTVERTIAMDQFHDTWRVRATPCRTAAFMWADLTSESAPSGQPVSQRFATSLMSERRGASVRWQVRRLVVACQLEQRFEDRQLLRMWLAGASFGRDAVGLEDAARTIFSKPSAALNAEESARLAALLRSPRLRTQPEEWAERAREIEARVVPRAQ